MSRSKGLIIAVLVLGSLGGLGVVFADRVEASLEAKRLAEVPVEIDAPRVRTEPLGRHELAAEVRFTGTLRAVRRVDVVPEIAFGSQQATGVLQPAAIIRGTKARNTLMR